MSTPSMLSYNTRRWALVSSYSPSARPSVPLVRRPPLLSDAAFGPPELLSPPEAAGRYDEVCSRPRTVEPAIVGLGFQFGDWIPEGSDRLQSAFDLKLVSRKGLYKTGPDDGPRSDHGQVASKSFGGAFVKRLTAIWGKVMRRT
ncbi:hypothetical protein BD309DRAFT_928415 [Dichomitus squalens]|uniref:Uncharacterized protein n=1 Tax=Dichomitus squalens TaxID=114155 RepID=A0A4Q9PMV8_9APHY|nr:uncharacterized protein DICSQDRAFT_166668 [Dichomitus squalens LYAD-421 SS1]EJF64504.1 hypothetical protein DICSQDRAFT_166668 [Dichomitus squalens LYAD-421 SS1]TBU39760.1 hypothetical protein BD309DRAFT_928415 [Dichomitus squalens]TBU55599.1 hypothetical protein BD310DRAFT_884158 [Dichomitus squalens]